MLIYTRPPLALDPPLSLSLVFAFALSFSRPLVHSYYSPVRLHGILSLSLFPTLSLSLSPVSWWSSRAKTVTTRRLLRSARGRSLALLVALPRALSASSFARQQIGKIEFADCCSHPVHIGGSSSADPSRSFEIDAGGGGESASARVLLHLLLLAPPISLFSYLRDRREITKAHSL